MDDGRFNDEEIQKRLRELQTEFQLFFSSAYGLNRNKHSYHYLKFLSYLELAWVEFNESRGEMYYSAPIKHERLRDITTAKWREDRKSNSKKGRA